MSDRFSVWTSLSADEDSALIGGRWSWIVRVLGLAEDDAWTLNGEREDGTDGRTAVEKADESTGRGARTVGDAILRRCRCW